MTEQESVSLEKEVEQPNEEVQADNETPDAAPEPADEVDETERRQPERVPLKALQRERAKRQELEERIRQLEEQSSKKAEPDDTQYESATKADLKKLGNDTIRMVEERKWIKDNPERFQRIQEELTAFLKQRPNLASAIEAATNRYEEAWELMDKLTPKQKTALKQAAIPRKEAPGNPASVSKAAAVNETMDIMAMDDAEYNKWRASKRRARA